VDAMKLGAYDYIEKAVSRGKDAGCCCSAWLKGSRLVTENEFLPRAGDNGETSMATSAVREYPGCPAHDFPAERYTDAGIDIGEGHGKELRPRDSLPGAMAKNAFS